MSDKYHWQNVYQMKRLDQLSWFQPHLKTSCEMILKSGLNENAEIIDVGGGAATLAEDLLSHGYKHISVLDISQEALSIAKNRFEMRAKEIIWIEGDITTMDLPKNRYDLWHDRALFHFFIRDDDRHEYISRITNALKPGGQAIIATFGTQGPTRCSGLDVSRYTPGTLLSAMGRNFSLVESLKEEHETPEGMVQSFIYCRFLRHPIDRAAASLA